MLNVQEKASLMDLPVDDMINVMVERSQKAFKVLKNFDQAQVDAICAAVADTARRHARALATLAVKETKRGKAEDKAIKNIYASQYIWNFIKDHKTAGVIEDDPLTGITKIAEPLGVVAGVTPVTNPTSTVIFKILLALKTRNTIIFGLHPQAQECGSATCRLLAQAAEKAGAPKDCIQWIPKPSIEATSALMNNEGVAIVLATGGPAMVASAYSTGKPALGVGPGNAPAYIEKSANVDGAVTDIMTSKTFDNGMICATENSVVIDQEVYDQAKKAFQAQGAYFVPDNEVQQLSDTVIDPKRHTVRGPIAGQSAEHIAEMAGIKVPAGTKVLVVELGGIGLNYPLSGEKLCPVLSMYKAVDTTSGFNLCLALLNYGGLGHTAAIHSKNNDIINAFGEKMPACRILVNTPASLGGIGGLFNKMEPSLTLGTGSYGKNSISHNLTDKDLLNIKILARATRHPLELIAELRDVLSVQPKTL